MLITFKLGIFRAERERYRSEAALKSLLWALVKTNLHYLKDNPRTLPIYHSGVVYRRELDEEWRDIPTLLEAGEGDCEDLSCWRAAELIFRKGIPARPMLSLKRFNVGGTLRGLYHVRVLLPGGRIEDPSAVLGMKNEG